MYKTKDGIEVPKRCWEYLIEWILQDKHNILQELYNVRSLEELTYPRFRNFWHVATQSEIILS